MSIFLHNFEDTALLSSILSVGVKNYNIVIFNLSCMTSFASFILSENILFLKVCHHTSHEELLIHNAGISWAVF